ncbi:MAG: 1-acyl-sn-glycerol-3-phosphate acyltransferase, partial [Alphaproteobacteria bacterium]|nr:1-acyl-sn-glycerol-3-phosphate acyltransferase [Alphaproteobacteria bacterium]
MTFLRSLLFFVYFITLSVVLCIVCVPLLLGPREGAGWLGRTWSRAVFWGLRVIAGTRYEVRGVMPTEPVLV